MPRIKKTQFLLENVCEEFMINCTNKDLTKKTLMAYESSLKLFFKYLEEEFNISELLKVEEKHIKEYLNFTKERGKYSFVANEESTNINKPQNRTDFGREISKGTLNNYLRNIKVFFNFCFDNNYINMNPVARIRQFKTTRRPKEDITDNDFKKLIKAIDTTTLHGHRDYVFIHLLMDTGMRVGEALSLKEDNVLNDKRAIFISSDICKGRKDRYVFYSQTMQKILNRWIDYKDRYLNTDLLFPTIKGSKMEVTNMEKNVKKYILKAGLNSSINCHHFRNNFGRRALMSGMSIYQLSQILGHSSVKVTEDAYADLSVEDIRKSYQLHSPLENMTNK
ncbi:tyrosine-type recombinase/integrase [Clostridium tagluense]|uniref:tyrosine-type recombinase/integrase n=1 Tax=Clostridium tagluense TaxID=360422 RepID=UPI001CF494EF|nr:tyrosine-type recombinase/integrase [Clostridium tagluense]MCB2297078.1 tyrosine-type recombinase/integrase [Clostridium tagluense]